MEWKTHKKRKTANIDRKCILLGDTCNWFPKESLKGVVRKKGSEIGLIYFFRISRWSMKINLPTFYVLHKKLKGMMVMNQV